MSAHWHPSMKKGLSAIIFINLSAMSLCCMPQPLTFLFNHPVPETTLSISPFTPHPCSFSFYR